MLIAVLGIALLAQSSVTIQVGTTGKPDSTGRRDSIAIAREMRLDSIRAARLVRDSASRARRRARQIQLTPAHLATAFRDPTARNLVSEARRARLEQDTSLLSYDATAYERMSVGMGLRRIGRSRLLFRTEQAARVIWSRGNPVYAQVLGSRQVAPVLEGAGTVGVEREHVPIPYFPGRESLWMGSALARADISEGELIHPLVPGAEAYYTYATGDSVSFQLPGGRTVQLRELVVRPREPRWNVALGSLWFDVESARLVRAVYRLAEPLDIWGIAAENAEADDDRPPRWVTGMITPLTASISAITIEYGLHEGRIWMPRAQGLEGEARAGFMYVPFKLEQSFRYASVNGSVPVAIPAIAPGDTARDSVSRAARRELRRRECDDPTAKRKRVSSQYEGTVRVIVEVPCDTAVLASSADLPRSIYDEGETVFGSAERDELIAAALSLGAQAGFVPQRPVITYGLGLTRYNRIEGISTGIAVRQALGGGYTARASARIGAADRAPNAELSLVRSNGRRAIGVGAYRRLASTNEFADPFSFSSSLSALLFGRDEGFYYRTLGVELSGTRDDSASGAWRLFAEHHTDVAKNTDVSLAHTLGADGFTENIQAARGETVGLMVERHGSRGLDPHGLRLFGGARVEAAAGDFDYARAMFDATVSHGLGPRLDGAITVGAGTSGGAVPPQRLWYLGGTHTVRGQRPGAAVGDAFWMTHLELGSSFVGARPVVFGDLGWAGSRKNFGNPGRPLSGAGVGVSFLDGLVRFDVAKGIYPEKAVRASLYVEARF